MEYPIEVWVNGECVLVGSYDGERMEALVATIKTEFEKAKENE